MNEISYILLVLAADLLAARWIVPLPFGLAVPAGVFPIALIFTVRDDIHEKYGRKGAYALITIASVLSWVLSAILGSSLLARVTLASVAAFALNEIVDTEIYHTLRKRNRFMAILGSNAVSAALDSVIFIAIAFGWNWSLIVGQYAVKMVLSSLWGGWRVYGTAILRNLKRNKMESPSN
jgi:uncharacterized PurR-regulated membrane protein YhhQ (DUF165 family)